MGHKTVDKIPGLLALATYSQEIKGQVCISGVSIPKFIFSQSEALTTALSCWYIQVSDLIS